VSQQEATTIFNTLTTYQKAFGQMVNIDIFEASFSQNVLEADSQFICNMMGVTIMADQNRYLGLPIGFER
jgi:hypothetical protein